MISVEEALARILADIEPLQPTQVPLPSSLGLVLAQDIIAQEDIPPFANSAMDGFALLSQDSKQQHSTPPRLRVTGSIAAGYVSDQPVLPGTAQRIMTGAPLPRGADAVIQVELTRSDDAQSSSPWVEVLQEVAPGTNTRPAAEDMHAGQTVIMRGTEIGPWEIGVLATLGWSSVPVIQCARVAIVSTGDELVDVAQTPGPGQIRNSNSYLLEAAVLRAGASAYRLGTARDTIESLRATFAEAARHDLIFTSGGVSVGDFDLVKDIMQEQGAMDFWQINMRPGKPVAFGHILGKPLLGLPGNPVSSAVTFELFGRPTIRKMQGHQALLKPQIEVLVEDTYLAGAPRRHYVRARVERHNGRFIAHPTGNQASNITTSLLHANALVIVPENGPGIKPGESARAIMLDWPETFA